MRLVDSPEGLSQLQKTRYSPSNTSHLYLTPSEQFSHPLFPVGTLGGKQGWVLGKGGEREETQDFLTV